MGDMTENFQLKWHSFSSHLHSCVASAWNKELFTDVYLYTFDGCKLPTHRFVLSACSQYLHDILKVQQKIASSLPLVIILPHEIDYKTMSILLQYMYSGEATVSKDILENVLRGGDLLKVRGLWRPRDEKGNEKKVVRIQEQNVSRTAPKPSGNSECPKQNENATEQNAEVSSKPRKGTTNINTDLTTSRDAASQNEDKTVGDKNPDASAENTTKDTLEIQSESMDNLQYLVIKEEPIEWAELEDGEMEMIEDGSVFEADIKPEVVLDDPDEKSDELYSPLTCELCSETFSIPAEWVRHIQTHTDMLPAKRQRRGKSLDEDNGNFPPLHCDMCQKYYPTPAEWVRHIQNSHTEFELRVSNKTSPIRTFKIKHSDSVHKLCTVCNKKFPSHASMIIHKRTHTGEKPYVCEHCFKGFNVKSNLLRHLRTLHDRIINSAEIEYKENDNITN